MALPQTGVKCRKCGGEVRYPGSSGLCRPCFAREMQRRSVRAARARTQWQPTEVMPEILRLAAELGRTPSTRMVPAALVTAARCRYGSWSLALRAAGFDPPRSVARGNEGIPRPDAAWLAKTYADLSANQIGKMLGVGHGTVIGWLKQYGIETRGLPEAIQMAKVTRSQSAAYGRNRTMVTGDGHRDAHSGSVKHYEAGGGHGAFR